MPKRKKAEPEPKKPEPNLMAELMMQRQERVKRAQQAIREVCQKERVDIVVTGFDIMDGKLQGRVNLIAVDQA